MLTLEWSEASLDDLDAIADYIGERNPEAADRLIERIKAFAERLAEFPYMHRSGRVPGTREAVAHPNYIVIYHITDQRIEILSVLHTRQNYP